MTFLHHGSGKDRRALAARHAQRFAGHGGLIDQRAAVLHNAVHWDGAAVAHHHQIALADLAQRHGDFRAVLAEQPGAVHIQGKAFGQTVQRAAAGPVFQSFAQSQQQCQHADRAEVAHKQRNGDGRRIQHLHAEPAAQQGAEPLEQKRHGRGDAGDHAPDRGQKGADDKKAYQRQQAARRRLFRQKLRRGGREIRAARVAHGVHGIMGGQQAQGRHTAFLVGVEKKQAAHAGVDVHPTDAGQFFQVSGQLGGRNRGQGTAGAHAHPAGGGSVETLKFMDDGKRHARSSLKKKALNRAGKNGPGPEAHAGDAARPGME